MNKFLAPVLCISLAIFGTYFSTKWLLSPAKPVPEEIGYCVDANTGRRTVLLVYKGKIILDNAGMATADGKRRYWPAFNEACSVDVDGYETVRRKPVPVEPEPEPQGSLQADTGGK